MVLESFPAVEVSPTHSVSRELRRVSDELGAASFEGRVRCSCKRTQYVAFQGQPTVPEAEWLLFHKARALHICNCGPVLLTEA